MKIQFDSNQDYQLEAINSIVDIFAWSSKIIPWFRMRRGDSFDVVKNIIDLDESTILKNLNQIQEKNNLSITNDIKNFSIEMETWTWKTYVFLRTIFELNEKYGLSKFIIIVPSVAIRAWTIKNLEITREHFRGLYPNVHLNYFEYDSSKINKIKHFCEWTWLQIMIITSSAFVWDNKIINQEKRDEIWSKSLLEQIAEINPILVIDEPQSVEWVETKKKIKDFNPLFTLRYSATHRTEYSFVYKLSPFEAYQKWLVKQVWVLWITWSSDSNIPSIEVVDIWHDNKWKLEVKLNLVSIDSKNTIKTISKKLKPDLKNCSLEAKSWNSVYRWLFIEKITIEEVSITWWIVLKKWETTSKQNIDIIKLQIDKAIEKHFQKREELKTHWIKPLCLFFIDKVWYFLDWLLTPEEKDLEWYIRKYFENKLKDYLWEDEKDLTKYYKYYFASKTNSKTWKQEFKDELKNNEQDKKLEKEAYDLIMKSKEKLISFEEPTEFIFSHSALKEWWDNPNVFTICTLRNTQSDIRKRQEIWRWMRLAVKQDWQREFSKELNKLSVVVNESYEDFVTNYQRDLEDNYWYSSSDSKNIADNISNEEKIQSFKLIEENIKNDSFKNFWNSINKKTFFYVNFKEEDLIKNSIDKINESISTYQIQWQNYNIWEVKMVYDEESKKFKSLELDYARKELKNTYKIDSIIKLFTEELPLSKKVIFEIFKWINIDIKKTLLKNPIMFVKEISKIINYVKSNLESNKDNIKYYLSDETYNYEVIFIDKEIKLDTSKKWVVSTIWLNQKCKSLYEKLNIDSNVERDFVDRFVNDSNVLFFFKIPSQKFQIKTPIWNYSPDWWVIIKNWQKNEIHFVIENKWTTSWEQLKEVEQNKIFCTRIHFDTLKTNVKYNYFDNYDKFRNEYSEILG